MTYTSTSTTATECMFLYGINRACRAAAENCEADTPRQLGAMIKRLMRALCGQYEMPGDWLRHVDQIVTLYANTPIETMRECLIDTADLVQPAEAQRYRELTGQRIED